MYAECQELTQLLGHNCDHTNFFLVDQWTAHRSDGYTQLRGCINDWWSSGLD